MKNKKKTNDQTERLVARIQSHIDRGMPTKSMSDTVYKLLDAFVRKPFNLTSILIGHDSNMSDKEKERLISKGVKEVWMFDESSEVAKGELSASRVAAILIKYRNTLKTFGAVNPDFKSSLKNAKATLRTLGLADDDISPLKDNIEISTLESRIASLSKKYVKRNGYDDRIIEPVRAALSSIKIYHPFYYRLYLPLYYVKAMANSKQTHALKDKHDGRLDVNPDTVYALAVDILNNRKHHDWVDLTIALCALTGRRPTEIMKTASFKKHPEIDGYAIFNGILKSRDRNLDEDFGNWPIPVFADPDLITSGLRSMRAKLSYAERNKKDGVRTGGKLSFMTRTGQKVEASIFDKAYTNDLDHNEAINQQYSGTLNERVRSLFSSTAISMKTLRALYTKAVWEKEKDQVSGSYDALATRILCYSQKTLSSAVPHYSAIEINRDIDGFKELVDENKVSVCASLVEKLKEADAKIELKSRKAKKLSDIHDWAKAQAEKGLSTDDLTISYIRKHCRLGGKQIGFDTAGLYVVLVDLVDELETQKMIYSKDDQGNWLVTSKKTEETKSLF